jgi:S1-C subfamily serine protease
MKKAIGRTLGLTLLALLVLPAWGMPKQGSGQGQQNPPPKPAQPGQPAQPAQVSLQQIFKQNAPAVVLIMRLDAARKPVALGSGFLISPSGVIVTNHHVIAPKSSARLLVKLANGDAFDDVWVIHDDARRDLAVISIKASGLPTAKLGDSEKVEVGDQVVAIGNPEGLSSTFTVGIVSNIRSDPEGYRYIQHQTPISPGSSGGPLLNMKGEVVGVNSFTFGGQNLNGAIPINYTKPYLQDPPKMTYEAYVRSQVVPSEVAEKQPPAAPGAGQPVQPGTPATPPVNKEEEDAYKAFFEVGPGNPQLRIQFGEDFLKKFPESRYREGVYSSLANAYLSAGQEDKMFVAGEKVLELNQNNVDMLALMALTMPRRVSMNSLDAEQKLQKSEKYSKQGISLIEAMAKPANMADEDFTKAKNEKLSMCHSGLGVTYFHRQKFADAAAELEQATKLAAAPDPVDFYVLGIAYHQAKHFADAATAFGHCGEITSQLQEACKKNAEADKKLASTQLAPPAKP